jgi:hypothetical protein
MPKDAEGKSSSFQVRSLERLSGFASPDGGVEATPVIGAQTHERPSFPRGAPP